MTDERANGPTPNGGVYAIAHYLANGKPAEKAEADAVEIVEYDDKNHEIQRTYATICKGNMGKLNTVMEDISSAMVNLTEDAFPITPPSTFRTRRS